MHPSGTYDRTRKSIRNSVIAVTLQVVSLLIGFWSRRIFLNHLGTEILGLNTTAQSLLGFLNIAELGIGGAIAVTLYRPIFEEDRKTIKEIVALQGWLYRMVALAVMVGSAVLMCFFPLIFSKSGLPLRYAYSSFGVFLYGSLLGYFFNYKQILLDAHQQNYKIQLSVKLISIFKLVSQAFALKFFSEGYLWWLCLEFAFSTLTAVILSRTVNRNFPFIREKVLNPSSLRFKYPVVVTKVKQMLFHKLSGFVTGQSTPLLVYAFASLTVVAKYGNYLILTTNLTAIFESMFAGLAASVGNMVAESNKQLTMKVFREMFSFRFWMTAVSCICLWYLTDPFISLWIGPDYILDRSTLALMVILFYISGTRSVVDSFLMAYGMYSDIWAPMVQALISLGLAILFGCFWGLDGVLSGFIVGQLIIIKGWKPFFLFRRGLIESYFIYFKILAKHLAAAALTFFVVHGVAGTVTINAYDSFASFFVYALVIFAVSAVLMFCILFYTEDGMKNFTRRIRNLL